MPVDFSRALGSLGRLPSNGGCLCIPRLSLRSSHGPGRSLACPLAAGGGDYASWRKLPEPRRALPASRSPRETSKKPRPSLPRSGLACLAGFAQLPVTRFLFRRFGRQPKASCLAFGGQNQLSMVKGEMGWESAGVFRRALYLNVFSASPVQAFCLC